MSNLQKTLVVALMSFVGALLALEINGQFWWLGCLAAGLITYFAVNFGGYPFLCKHCLP